MAKITAHTPESLKARCEIQNNCWIWQGYTEKDSPYVSHEGKMQSVRKLLFSWSGKPAIPDAKYFSYRCRNHLCVNPDHILPRTQKMQSTAMAKKVDHNARARILKLQKYARGRNHVKLDEEKANAIRQDSRASSKIAQEYSVSKSLIARVKSGKAWKNLSAASNPWIGLMQIR